jgi:hypothetical protein
LVDTPDLGSGAVRYVGSSPILGKVFILNEKSSPLNRTRLKNRIFGLAKAPIIDDLKLNRMQSEMVQFIVGQFLSLKTGPNFSGRRF